ncbi:Phosphoribosyl 1,2-cyclic phosphodiesterase [uncultured Gammaproteobacteria bacterium]
MALSVKFWGVRGTIPCPFASHLGYGGNTSCVEVTDGKHVIMLDAGTGIRMLGRRILAEGTRSATLLLSHTHLDHISGFPFFMPAFQPGFNFRVLAGHLSGNTDIQTVLARQMERPLFPVPMQTMGCSLEFEDVHPGAEFDLASGFHVRTAPLNHPDGATGWRLEHGGHSVVYITDTEHVPGCPDQNILGLMEGADLVIYDSTYTDDEWQTKIGWGHSTWQEAVRLFKASGARRLALFHHDPDHDDDFIADVEREARAINPNVFAARENQTLIFD